MAAEEPEITSIAVRPGVVDTQMQQDVKNIHTAKMSDKDAKKFHDLHREGKLLRPEQPGNIMARLAMDGPHELSGKYLRWSTPLPLSDGLQLTYLNSWNDEILADLQDKQVRE